MEPIATKGTTLEVLAPYLPYGIEVETTYENGLLFQKGSRHPLTGFNTLEDYPVLAGEASFACQAVLPVLRPFSQLCDPLPDGTVPIVEVAKLALDSGYAPLRRRYQLFDFKHPRLPRPYPDAAYVHISNQQVLEHTIKVDSEFNVSVSRQSSIHATPTWNQPAITNYLRSQHFAVGLADTQFIVK